MIKNRNLSFTTHFQNSSPVKTYWVSGQTKTSTFNSRNNTNTSTSALSTPILMEDQAQVDCWGSARPSSWRNRHRSIAEARHAHHHGGPGAGRLLRLSTPIIMEDQPTLHCQTVVGLQLVKWHFKWHGHAARRISSYENFPVCQDFWIVLCDVILSTPNMTSQSLFPYELTPVILVTSH